MVGSFQALVRRALESWGVIKGAMQQSGQIHSVDLHMGVLQTWLLSGVTGSLSMAIPP